MKYFKNKYIKLLVVFTFVMVGTIVRYSRSSEPLVESIELATVLFSTGHSLSDADEILSNNRLISSKEIKEMLFRPDSPMDFFRDVKSFSFYDAHVSPLYYSFCNIGIRIFENTPPIKVIKIISMIGSLLLLIGVFWCCRLLFCVNEVGMLAVIFLCVSPIQIWLGSWGRPYSWWSATSILSTAALLWASERESLKSWITYVLFSAMALYFHGLSIFLFIPHVLYIILRSKGDYRKYKNFLFSLGLIFLICLPHVVNIFYYRFESSSENLSWIYQLNIALKYKLAHLNNVLISGNFLTLQDAYPGHWMNTILTIILSVLIVLGVKELLKKYSKEKSILIISLYLVLPLSMLILDLLLGGGRVQVVRYLVPSSVITIILLSSYLYNKFKYSFIKLICLICLCIQGLSIYKVFTSEDYQFNDDFSHNVVYKIRKYLKKSEKYLVVSTGHVNLPLMLSLVVDDSVEFKFISEKSVNLDEIRKLNAKYELLFFTKDVGHIYEPYTSQYERVLDQLEGEFKFSPVGSHNLIKLSDD